MGNETGGSVARDLATLWSLGAVGQADDGALLARYVADREDSGEEAFRVLVDRHGPMVVRVCREVLRDDHAALDAAQAVFLVLARKAGSIRARGTIAPWLHGVAWRVARKARRRASIRRVHESTAATEAARHRDRSADRPGPATIDGEALHAEVAALPEKYRAPVVLCYLDGLTYDEAARRLNCPVGTIRVRLSRARDRLRKRLVHRGFGPPTLAILAPASIALPGGWAGATTRLARASLSASGTVPGPMLALVHSYGRMLMLTQIKCGALGLIALGGIAVGGKALVGQQVPTDSPRPAVPGSKTNPTPAPAPADREREVLSHLLENALTRMRLAAQYYEVGRTGYGIDRLLAASKDLADTETSVATTREQRIAAARDHLNRLNDYVEKEQSEQAAGRSAKIDLAEALNARSLAELRLLQAETGDDPRDVAALERRLAATEKELARVVKLLDAMKPAAGNTPNPDRLVPPPSR